MTDAKDYGEQMTNTHPQKTAAISDCGKYRYQLTRKWDNSLEDLVWIMLNPSTADATVDDPTIRKCCGFARRWGYGGIIVVNLFSYRSTDPTCVQVIDSPIGQRTDFYIKEAVHSRDVVCAWGAHGEFLGRGNDVKNDLINNYSPKSVLCLGLTNSGQPKHPLYISYKVKPIQL